jgi:hypothetical protein
MTEQKNGQKHDAGRRKGVWAEVEGGTFIEPVSRLAAIVTERIRGRAAYSFAIVQMFEDGSGANKFIQVPIPGEWDVEHVVFSLVKRAREFIQEKMVQNKMTPSSDEKRDEKRGDVERPKPNNKPRRERGNRGPGHGRGPQGLSALAKEDSKGKEQPFVGKTKRHKERKSAS